MVGGIGGAAVALGLLALAAALAATFTVPRRPWRDGCEVERLIEAGGVAGLALLALGLFLLTLARLD
jgi:hypothetical protein